MGRVTVGVLIENQYDLFEVSQGRRKPDEVRRVHIPDASWTPAPRCSHCRAA